MKLVMVSTYQPRRCGLAAFTADLRTALLKLSPNWTVNVCAIDRDGLSYGPEVIEVIRQDCPDDYGRAARNLAMRGADCLAIQHEFGIFGGPDGSYVLDLADGLRRLGVPYVVTLHTVLSQPSRGQAATLTTLCSGAARVTGFTATARHLASTTGVAHPDRFTVVPHGAPALLRAAAGDQPGRLRPAVREVVAGVGAGWMLSTFGLIGPGKGLETAIAALPAVVARHSDVRYVIAGATHPEVARAGRDTYRTQLIRLGHELGIGDHLRFIPAFLSEPELAALLARTDLYLTPYRTPEQICSGALTFALAAGVPVVSTAYRYAVDMVTPPGRPAAGVLVPFDDPAAFARGVLALLDDPGRLTAARRSAREYGDGLLWPSVAARFARVYADVVAACPPITVPARPPRHLASLIDEIGIIQFARGATPDPDSGYCVDDAARLAIVATGLAQSARPGADQDTDLVVGWLTAALRLIEASVTIEGLHNQLGYDGVWLDSGHPGDHVGRACWAIGVVAASILPASLPARARLMLDAVLPLVGRLTAHRSRAYALLGLAALGDPSGAEVATMRAAASALAAAVATEDGWHWFEPVLTYDNARLPQALLAAGSALGETSMTALGLSTLDWYLSEVGLVGTRPMLRLVGNRWRYRGQRRALDEGDEQPLDAAATVEALVQAYQTTGDRRYANLARRAFEWFHGRNRVGTSLYDPTTGGCRDGLSSAGASTNQGAESTLAYYQALLTLDRVALRRVGRPSVTSVARGLHARQPALTLREHQ